MFLCSCNSIPFLCKLISLLRLLCVCLFLCKLVKKPRRMHTISTNKPFNSAPSEPIHPFLNVSSVQSYCLERVRWWRGGCTSINTHFLILRIHLPSLKCELMGQQKKQEGGGTRKVLVSGEAKELFLSLTHHPCSHMTNFLEKDLRKSFCHMSSFHPLEPV